jgi:phosphohistidine phosphatase
MKTIYIVRHAKSSWDRADLADEERPLMEKGRKRTRKVIDYLVENNVKVDYIISSHAVRAHETAKLIATGIKFPVEQIVTDHQIYHADSDGILSLCYGFPEQFDSVMIVGHNPTLTDFANFFLDSPVDNIPTSGVISIIFNTDRWNRIPVVSRKTNFILFPKELPD